jgi:hypothetical protein
MSYPKLKLFLLCLLILGTTSYGKSYKFKFNPSDHMSYKFSEVSTKIINLGILGTESESRRVTTNVTISETEIGYNMKHEVEDIVLLENGAPIYSPLTTIMKRMSFTYVLDKNGYLIDVDGIDSFLEDLNALLPPEIIPQLASIFNKESLLIQERSEYENRYEKYLGKKVKTKDVWSEEMPFELSGMNPLLYYVITTFKKGTESKLEINYTYVTDPADLTALPELIQDSLNETFPNGERLTFEGGMNITGEGKIQLNPSTMKISKENVTRHFSQEMNVPNIGLIDSKITESRETIFIYE